MKPATILGAALLAFTLGIFIGWRAGGTTSAKAEATAADARTEAITDHVSKGLALRQAELTNEQQATLRLTRTVDGIHIAATERRLEISNARFDPPANAGACADPVGSDDFVRLYNAPTSAGRFAGDSAAAGAR